MLNREDEGMEREDKDKDMEGDSDDDHPADSSRPPWQISGLVELIDSLEMSAIHMTRSVTACLNLFMTAPPKTVLLDEDHKRSPEAWLAEIRSLRQQLLATHQALGRAIG